MSLIFCDSLCSEDPSQGSPPVNLNIPPEELDIAFGRGDQPEYHTYGGALTCAVGPEKSEDLSTAKFQVQVFDYFQPAKAFAEAYCAEDHVFLFHSLTPNPLTRKSEINPNYPGPKAMRGPMSLPSCATLHLQKTIALDPVDRRTLRWGKHYNAYYLCILVLFL